MEACNNLTENGYPCATGNEDYDTKDTDFCEDCQEERLYEWRHRYGTPLANAKQ